MKKITISGEELKDVFDEWELRICILLSLLLQILLTLTGRLRRILSGKLVDTMLGSAYLLADGTAILTVGLILSRQSDYFNHCINAPRNNVLQTFWAPFLLVHLGGPDTITALALEDNELWLRHLFALFTQCVAVAYVMFQSVTPLNFWIPTLLMFMCAIIKYAQRTYALYCASANSFRNSLLEKPDPGLNYAKLMGEYTAKKDGELPSRIELLPEPQKAIKAVNRVKYNDLSDLEVVQYAFRYFTSFKGLAVDPIFNLRERRESRDFFLARSAKDAFRVVEVELNFLYDVLFTKVPVVYNRVGYFYRALSVAAIVTSTVIFHYVDKSPFQGFEIGITYTLLIGGITMEAIAFFMLLLSDWTVVKLRASPYENPNKKSLKVKFVNWLVLFNVKKGTFVSWLLNIGDSDHRTNSRWNECLETYNLINYCLHKRSEKKEKFVHLICLKAFFDEISYVEPHPVTSSMKKFIFNELKTKSEMADDLDTAKEICSAKGEWALHIEGHSGSPLFPFVADTDYDESLLLWHIATELCYNSSEYYHYEDDEQHSEERENAKLMSDYMIFLLVMRPDMMSAVSGIGMIRFRDTCAEAKKFFESELPDRKKKKSWFVGKETKKKNNEELQRMACDKILSVNTILKPVTVKGGRCKSVLFNASILAKELLNKNKYTYKERWVIISKVWVELLSYAASHIRSNAHAQQLSKGGQLITVVWLLMAQFGLGDQFQSDEGNARAKLIVGK